MARSGGASSWELFGRRICAKSDIIAFLRHLGIVSLMKHHTSKTSMGERIADARTCSNLTTAQLSRRLGVLPSTLRDWQRDASQPRANRLAMLAGVLGVSPAWLLIGRGAGPLRQA
jgi:hypothetical protein